MNAPERIIEVFSGDGHLKSNSRGVWVGSLLPVPFPNVAAVADGVALSTIQSRLFLGRKHLLRGGLGGAGAATPVVAGTDPTFDIYKHLPVMPAPTAALISPAAAGSCTDGVHKIAVVPYNAAGNGMPSETVSVTVSNNTVNGKIVVSISSLPYGATGWKVYMTEAAGTQLKLAATVASTTTLTTTLNLADGSLGANVNTSDASGVSIFSAPVALSAADRALVDQAFRGDLSYSQTEVLDPCMYSLHALTGATTGAIANLQAWLELEFFPE